MFIQKYVNTIIYLFIICSISPTIAADKNTEFPISSKYNGNVEKGKEKALAHNCFECHGEEGIGISSGYPNLAGQYPEYIIKQIQNFRTGERRAPFMNNIAAVIDDQDMIDVAIYFSSKQKNKEKNTLENKVAKDLYFNGDKTRNIIACSLCHGNNGQGIRSSEQVYPMIGGQQMYYLREQLLNWRLGTRSNSPDRIMNKVSQALTEEEIEALSHFISTM